MPASSPDSGRDAGLVAIGPDSPSPRVAPSGERSSFGDGRPRGTSAAVLVVEDESGVRFLARMILERAGYRVLDARNAGEAERLFAGEVGGIRALVTDIMMPEHTGPELYDRLVVRQPGLRVVYMSGYAAETAFDHRLLTADAVFLEKPFTAEALLTCLREALTR